MIVDFISKDDIIIFNPEFNNKIDDNLIKNYNQIIFSNFDLDDLLFKIYKNYENDEYYDFYKFCLIKKKIEIENLINTINLNYSKFNQKINLHKNLTHIIFGCCFNQIVNLPDSLTHLTFDYYSEFNQPINLPNSLTHLTFGKYFNQPIILNYDLRCLVFGMNFNQPINLTFNLTHLTFGNNFNQSINLPPNLTHLTFGNNFNQSINLPPNLTHLTLGFNFNQFIILTNTIKYLNLNCNNIKIIDYLPESIETLELGQCFELELNNLPISIKKLLFHVNSKYNKKINNLPKFIEYIQLPYNYFYIKIENIPDYLTEIKCNKNYKFINDFIELNVKINYIKKIDLVNYYSFEDY